MLSREEKLIQEYESILNGSDSSGDSSSENQALKKLLKGYKKTYKQLNKIIKISDLQQVELKELSNSLNVKTQKTRSLLDNADQGFLSFTHNCIIDEEFSRECIKLLGDDIAGKNFADIVYPNDKKNNSFLQETLKNVLDEKEMMIKEVMLSLLPKEIILNRRAIKVDYKIVSTEKFMVVLTNITKERILEKKIEQEQDILKMIVAVVSDPAQFYELKDDFKHFAENKSLFINEAVSFSMNLSEIYRGIHTFKGGFSQIRMQSAVKKLHALETKLSDLKKGNDYTNSDLSQILNESKMGQWMDADLSVIGEILGEDFFDKQHKLVVDNKFIFNIEDKITQLLHSDTRHITTYETILSEINKARGMSINQALSSFPKLCHDIANKTDKAIYDFKVTGGEDVLMPMHFKPFIKSLIHLFRNAVDHGIEELEARLIKGKSEKGLISCHVEDHSEFIKIIISDDGNGININHLKDKIRQAKIATPEALSKMKDKDVLAFIFHEGFSTNDEVSQLSGRGIGMSVVKVEVEKLSGFIQVDSKQGKGTTVVLTIPVAIYGNLINIASNPQDNITIEYVLSPLVSRVCSFIQSDMHFKLNKQAIYTYTTMQKVQLKEFTSYIHISGLVNVSVCMSFDQFLLDKLLEEFNHGYKVEADMLLEYRESVSMEVLNIIIGNVLFNPYDQSILKITSPHIIKQDELTTDAANEKVANVIIDTEFGEMQILIGRF